MTNYILAMCVGFAVLMFWPLSRSKAMRQTARALAGMVFSIGLFGMMSRLFLSA